MSTLAVHAAGAAPIAMTSATAPSILPVDRFFESFRLPASPRSITELAMHMVKNRMTAMPELALQDQGFEIAHRRAHAAIALAKRDEHRVERVLGKAGLRKPRPQVRPVPEIEGDLRHLVILEDFLQALGDKFVADRRAWRRFEIASLGP